jgi:hypothetical protein
MKPRHIRELKPMRDRQCAQELGPEYEYAGAVDFSKYDTLKQFREKNPALMRFYKKDCTVQQVPAPAMNAKAEHVFTEANTKWKCDKLKGHWDPNALSRKDFKLLGACFVRPEDKTCAKHDHRTLMELKHGKARVGHSVPLVTVSHHKSKCEQARTGCAWMPSTGQCHAKSTMKAKENKNKNKAVTTIQRALKRMMIQRRTKRAENERKRNVAARKIQAAYQEKKARNAVKRNVAARKIQAAYHEKKARNAVKRNVAARKIQAAYQEKKARNAEKKRMNAVMKVQRAVRARAEKRAVAAAKIQTTIRKHQQRADKLPSNWPVDLRQPGLKRYLLNYHTKSKDQWPVKTMPLRVPEGTNRCVKTAKNAEPLFTVPQAMLHAVARGLKPVNHGLLAWHSTGSGKTCSAAAIMDAYWKRKNTEIVFCTSIEAKASNPPEAFRTCLNTFLKRGVSQAAMARRVKFFSFAQLTHYLQLYRGSGPANERSKRANLLNNAVLIIDEVQNLLKPLPTQVQEHKALYDYLVNNSLDNLHVYILTATPGDTPQDIADLLNLIRDRRVPPIKPTDSVETFKEKIRGLVQHYDTNHDMSRFPRVIFKEPNRCDMSPAHYEAYAKALQEDLSKRQAAFPNPKYFALSRKYASHTFTRTGALSDFSCKIPQIHDKLRRYHDQKHWIYSAFYENRGSGQGVMAIKNTLLELGYEQLTPQMAKRMLTTGEFSAKRRFCVMTTTAVNNAHEVADLKNLYNHDLNANGALCHVMLASQKYNEGMDLKAVRHIHLLEPLLTEGMRQQAVGRARRSCSHFQLPSMSDWTVKIHEYISVGKAPPKVDVRANIQQGQTEILRLQYELEQIKGVRGVKPQRDELTRQLNELKASIRTLVKTQAEQNKIPDKVMFVDEHIRDLAREHYKPTQRMLDVMREMSIGALLH